MQTQRDPVTGEELGEVILKRSVDFPSGVKVGEDSDSKSKDKE